MPSGFVVVFKRSVNRPGKVADAEIRFTEGPLAGYKLTGFCIWEHSKVVSCTFPMRPYSVGGTQRRQELLKLVLAGPDPLRDLIVCQYKEALRGGKVN